MMEYFGDNWDLPSRQCWVSPTARAASNRDLFGDVSLRPYTWLESYAQSLTQKR
jgi:hypothetical protein